MKKAMMMEGSFVTTRELNVVGGALMRYEREPPRAPAVFGANFVLLFADSFVAGGATQDNVKIVNTMKTRTRRSDVKSDINIKISGFELLQDAWRNETQ